jgi:hypothetical protein
MRDKSTVQKILAAFIAIQTIFFVIDLFDPSFASQQNYSIFLVELGSFVVSITVSIYCYMRIDKTIPNKYKDLVLNCIAATIVVQLLFGVIESVVL